MEEETLCCHDPDMQRIVTPFLQVPSITLRCSAEPFYLLAGGTRGFHCQSQLGTSWDKPFFFPLLNKMTLQLA